MNRIKRFKRIISKFNNVKILVIGDLILDEFIWGEVSRISPEAPVPVVWVKNESFMPGGAANVANNIVSLDGKVYLAGVIGDDERGRLLKEKLDEEGADTDCIILDNSRPTTLKTRVIAHHQQVVRIDREDVAPINGPVFDELINRLKKIIPKVDAIIIEDYGKGVIIPELLKIVLSFAKRLNKIITVDPKEEHFSYYRDVTAITPNQSEASAACGIKIKDEESLQKAGQRLLARLKCDAILITLGERGMQLFEKGGRIVHIPTVAQEVFDVSGAGDTVIGAFTLCLGCGADMVDSAYISNYAAGIVVGKVGIAVTTQEELISRIK